jgi:membrane-associated phospholipid phosphatase
VLLPRLRWPLYAYLAAVAVTRVAFGAHFPIDVMAGTFLGHEFGLLAVTLLANARLLPARIVARQRGEPAHVPVRA